MKRRNYKHYIRKSHRYLGLCIGVQFLFWTIGGLYFSWTKIESIRSEDVRAEPSPIPIPAEFLAGRLSPANYLTDRAKVDMAKLRIVNVLNEPHYFLPFENSAGQADSILVRLSDATKREPLGEENARLIAKAALAPELPIESVELIEKGGTSKHHEYRGRLLPAYAVTFGGPQSYTVYVSTADWQVQTIRSNSWRVFDFLWMLHTMDLEGRDNINNNLLRTFSIFGIVTIMSGFVLFLVSSPMVRRVTRRRGIRR